MRLTVSPILKIQKNSFGYINFKVKIFLILYPRTWNSITGNAITIGLPPDPGWLTDRKSLRGKKVRSRLHLWDTITVGVLETNNKNALNVIKVSKKWVTKLFTGCWLYLEILSKDWDFIPKFESSDFTKI